MTTPTSAPRPRARPQIYFTDADKIDARRKWALRWKYKQEGVPEDEIDAKIEFKKKSQTGQEAQTPRKIKKERTFIKNEGNYG